MSSNVGDTVALQECDWTGAQPDIGSAPSVPSPYAGPGSEKQSVNPDGTDQDRTIIVVDDDEICRELASMFLKESGYDVLVASDGAELLQLLECTTPNLLLLDLDLPGLSGFDICQKVKADPRYADMPVIFLTGTTSPQAKERAFGVGGADYVTKPLEAVELLARIRCHLELAMNRKLLRLKANTFQAIATEQMGRLEQVRSGQASMLTNPATFSDLNLAVQFVPANEAGGDFYEIAGLGEDQFGLLVTDVAGHDLGVPFLTGALKGLGALCLGESLTACDTMIMLNSGLRKILNPEQYVTGCYARFNRTAMCLEVINAGHPPALLRRRDGRCEFLYAVGDVLGVFERVTFEPCQISVESGDRLFIYTDGLTEGYRDAQGRRGRSLFGTQQFMARVAALSDMDLGQVVNTIVEQCLSENGGSVQDDIVLLGVEF